MSTARLVPSLLLLGIVLLGLGLGSPGPALAHHAPQAPTAFALVHPTSPGPSGSPTAAPRPAAGFTVGIQAQTPTAASLNWSGASVFGISSYTVLQSSNGSGGPYSQIGVTSSSTTQFAATGLSPGASYSWMVTAAGWFASQNSSVVNGTQPTLAYLHYRVLTSTSIQLNWTNNGTYGALLAFVQYQLFETSAGATTQILLNTSVARNSFVVTGLGAGTSALFYLNTTDCVGSCGTSAPSNSVTQSNQVTYGTPLTLGASLVAERVVVDVNQSDLFTCTPSGGQSPFNFTWKIGTGTYVPSPSTATWAFPSAGSVTVTCWVQDSLGSHVTASTTTFVNPDPILNATANRTAADVGQSVAFACSASQGTGPFSLTWRPGNGQTYSGGDIVTSFTAAGSPVATCFAVDSTGTSVADSVQLVVSPPLGANARESAGAAAPGTLLNFSVAGVNGSGGFTGFSWTFGDGAHATGATVLHAFSAKGNYTVAVSLYDSNHGVATATLPVVITPISVTLSTFTTSITNGGWLNLTAVASGGAGGPYNFTWGLGDGTTAYGAVVSHRFTSTGGYPLTLTVKDGLGASASVAVGTVTVSNPPTPPTPSPWPLYLAIAGIVAVVLVIAFLAMAAVRRRNREKVFPAVAGRVPSHDAPTAVKGAKICARCGTANVASRRTCEACGAALGRSVVK